MSNKVYAYDDFGNKHETMKKDEIEQSIGAGGVRECVLTGCINYNKVDINFNYTGTLPSEAVISKLLAFGVDPENNLLTEAEVTSYLGLAMFSIHFYYLDAEIYVTNVNGTYLAYSKMGEGTFNVYPRKVEKFYFVKANEKNMDGSYAVENAKKINNLELKLDENGVLKIGDIIIPQRKLVASNIEFNTSEAGGLTTIYENVKAGCNYELEFDHLSNTIMKVKADTQYSNGYRAYNMLMWTGLESSTGLTEISVDVSPNRIRIGAYCIKDVTNPKDSTIAVNGTCKVVSLYEIIE